jgi:hypothetical protein
VRRRGTRRLIAILRANVDCRAARQARTPEEVVEFRSVVARKEYVVANERKPLDPRRHRPGEGRERSRGRRGCGDDAGGFGAAASVSQRGDVPIPDNGVRRYPLAVVRLHACGAAVLDDDPRDAPAEPEVGAASARKLTERSGEARHAALNDPNTLTLDVGDQHEGRRSKVRRRAAIGGVSPEKLAQPGIGEMIFERTRERRERRYPQEIRKAREAYPRCKFDGAGSGSADKRVPQRPIDRFGAFAKTAIAIRLPRARELRDRIRALVDVGIEVEAGTVLPAVASRIVRCKATSRDKRAPASSKICSNTQGMVSTVGPASIRRPPASTSRIFPPGPSAASSVVTWKPLVERAMDAARPPIPAPTTTTRRLTVIRPSKLAC